MDIGPDKDTTITHDRPDQVSMKSERGVPAVENSKIIVRNGKVQYIFFFHPCLGITFRPVSLEYYNNEVKGRMWSCTG